MRNHRYGSASGIRFVTVRSPGVVGVGNKYTLLHVSLAMFAMISTEYRVSLRALKSNAKESPLSFRGFKSRGAGGSIAVTE